ncbi:ras-related protein rab-20 [Plakobranchus ocellatus]|uniref:Ras-related protein rab-20 n=1 Tax=Plakobranchus ocellatus TaxID=259542 RepID=A0AAV4DPB1_9GAST|nr:ras-related protein rab-20 [Plakobranchus ocellatus]
MSVKKKADLKVIILGDYDVGKTSLICRYINGKFQKQESTVGAAFFFKPWGPYNIAVWDTAGDERYSGLSHFYCRSAGAAILAFDLNIPKTFESLWARFGSILDAANEDCLKIVVGTKSDVLDESTRDVSAEEGRKLALELNPDLDQAYVEMAGAPYFETSALKDENVTEMFEYIFQRCLPLSPEQHNRFKGKKSTIDLLEDSTEGPNRKKCC